MFKFLSMLFGRRLGLFYNELSGLRDYRFFIGKIREFAHEDLKLIRHLLEDTQSESTSAISCMLRLLSLNRRAHQGSVLLDYDL